MNDVMFCHVKGGYADYLSDTTRFFNKLTILKWVTSQLGTCDGWQLDMTYVMCTEV